MIYYPLSILMLSGIREILIISTPNDIPSYKRLLGNGEEFGLRIEYEVQPSPDGLAQAFIIGERFIGNDRVSLVLGDNIFYGHGLVDILMQAKNRTRGATVFGYHVADPERFGVVEFDEHQKVISIEEKPKNPKSNYAITGLYFYDNNVVEYSKKIKPSPRGELEITDINKEYLKQNNLNVSILGRGYAWLDTGTNKSYTEAGQYVEAIESRQGLKIACLEEIAYNNSWITSEMLETKVKNYNKSSYGRYLEQILARESYEKFWYWIIRS